MSPDFDPKPLVDFFEEKWRTPAGLVVACLLALWTETWLLPPQLPRAIGLLVRGLTLLVLLIAWRRSRRIPRVKRGKLGIVICLDCESDDEREHVREDFVRTLRELLKGGELGEGIQVVVIPDHVAQGVRDNEDAEALRQKAGAHLLLWGRIRLRTVGGEVRHILKLNGVVSHRPVSKPVQKELATEFSQLLPQQVLIARENDFLAFEFLSLWIDQVAKYIAGFAALISGDFNYAEKLFRTVEGALRSEPEDLPYVRMMNARLPKRLAEIYLARAKIAYNAWRKNHDAQALEAIGRELQNVPDTERERAVNLQAVWLFLGERDVEGAIRLLEHNRQVTDASWYYNLAFLYGYKGDLRKAIRLYRALENLDTPAIVLSQVEDFLALMMEREPGVFQLHYLLGFIMMTIRGDKIAAREEFEAFLSACPATQFAKERELTQKWLDELDQDSQTAESPG